MAAKCGCGCGKTVDSCGSAFTICNVKDILKCLKDFSADHIKRQNFTLITPTISVAITNGTLPVDPSKIWLHWNGLLQRYGSPIGSGVGWTHSGNTITFSYAIGSPAPVDPCGIEVFWVESESIAQYLTANCPDLATLLS